MVLLAYLWVWLFECVFCLLVEQAWPDRAKFCEQGYGVLRSVEENPPPLKQVMKLGGFKPL